MPWEPSQSRSHGHVQYSPLGGNKIAEPGLGSLRGRVRVLGGLAGPRWDRIQRGTEMLTLVGTDLTVQPFRGPYESRQWAEVFSSPSPGQLVEGRGQPMELPSDHPSWLRPSTLHLYIFAQAERILMRSVLTRYKFLVAMTKYPTEGTVGGATQSSA